MTDRVTIAAAALAAFLLVLALLARGLEHARGSQPAPRAVLVRRIYETTVVERVRGARSGATSTSSVAQPGPAASTAIPTAVTRTS